MAYVRALAPLARSRASAVSRKVHNSLLLYVAAALVLLNSGAVYFQQVFGPEMTFVLLGLALAAFRPTAIPVPVVAMLLLLNSLLVVNYAVYGNNLDGYIAVTMRVVAVAMIACSVDLLRFAHIALNVICFIAGVSIPFYAAGVIAPGAVRAAVPVTEVYEGEFFRLTPLYVYGPFNLDRNWGMFWEPGAFQVYLNVGLALTLMLPGVRYRTPRLVLLGAVLVTTFSTTGYLVAPLWFAMMVFARRRNSLATLATALASVGVAYLVWNSSTVLDKLDPTNSSYSRRLVDTTATFDLMMQRPFLGWGFQNISVLEDAYGGTNTSNSLTGFGYQFGLLALLGLLAFVCFALSRFGLNAIQTLLAMTAFVIIMSTENFILSPMFLMLMAGSMARDARKDPTTAAQRRVTPLRAWKPTQLTGPKR